MATRGKFGSVTERAKDVIVQELRKHFELNGSDNVLTEQPLIEKYGLPGNSPAETFIEITTGLPHESQRIPRVMVMSAPGVERKMGIGRQVVKTFYHPDTQQPTIREMIGVDLQIIIEIAAVAFLALTTKPLEVILKSVSDFFFVSSGAFPVI